MEEKFDAIIVGAGMAGCAAAYTLAKDGQNILVLERGNFAGAKNVSGGAFFGPEMNNLFPDFWKEAPVERFINRHVITFLSEESSVSIDFASSNFNEPPYNGFTVLRSKFDPWMAKKVEEAGAIVASGLKVDDLMWDNGRVAGVIAGGDEFAADLVIACDGANSQMAQKAGLLKPHSPEDMNQGVKEVIKLPRETLENRFNLTGDSGAAMEFVGFCSKGVHGGGFLYTNKESVSIGMVAQLKALMDNNIKGVELLEIFKAHPKVAPLIEGGETVEYSGHLVPAAGMKMMPQLYGDGIMITGDAASLTLSTGVSLEGMNFAVASGIAAAEAARKAREKGDFSKATLAQYETILKDSFILKDLEQFKKAPAFLENERLYQTYPDLVCNLAERVFRVDGSPKEKMRKIAREEMKGKVSLWQLLKDGIAAGRSM